MHPSRRILAVLAVAVLLLATGCARSVEVEPAADAANPGCAEVMLRLPEEIGSAERRDTTSQGTAVWGDPAVAVLRCGVDVPGPTTTQCVAVNDVDWLSREGEEDWEFTSYGRDPAVQVTVSTQEASGESVLTSLTSAVSVIEQTRECT